MKFASEPSVHLRVLVVEPDARAAQVLRGVFGEAVEASYVHTLAEARRACGKGLPAPDVVLSSSELPDGEATDLLVAVAAPLIVLTDAEGPTPSPALVQRGALYYLARTPEALPALPELVRHAERQWRLLQELASAELDLAARSLEFEIAERRSRSLELLAQRLRLAPNSEECVQHFVESTRSALGAEWVELWRGEVPSDRIGEPLRRLGADARRSGKALSFSEPVGTPGARFGLVVPILLLKPLPDLIVLSSEAALTEPDQLFLTLSAGFLEAALRAHALSQELRESQAQLHQAERMNSIGQLAGGIAHDFNNMLMVVSAAAEVMSEALEENHPCAPHVELIINTSHRAAELTQKLLAFSRKARRATQSVDLHELLGSVRELLSHALDRRIALQLSLAGAPCIIEADSTRLQNALLNVCLNARDAMPEGGRLQISTQRVELDASACVAMPAGTPGRYVRIEVRDTGTGMDAQTLEHAFDPFFTTKEPGRGTGLGLSIVAAAIREHGGSVSLESEPGHGSCCVILLPLIDGRHSVSSAPPAHERQQSGRRILLLDDEPAVCRTAAALMRQLGHNVQALRSGEKALSHLRTHSNGYDLLVLDVMMPQPTGVEVYRALREVGIVLPTIFMSGYSEQPLLAGLVDLGGVVFLQKPFRQSELASAIARSTPSPLPAIGQRARFEGPAG